MIIRNLDLHRIRNPVDRVRRIDQYPTVGPIRRFEFQIEREIFILAGRPDRLILAGRHDAVRHRPHAILKRRIR